MGTTSDEPNGFVYPPQLLATAAAVLRDAGWQIAGLDAVVRDLDPDTVIEQLPASELLVVTASFATLAADRAFLNRLRERKPLSKVLAIGPALSFPQVSHALSDLVDILLAGEPELAVPTAARRLLDGDIRPGEVVNPYELVPGSYHPDGRLLALDALPIPAWEIFLTGRDDFSFLTLHSSRGCAAGCRFCPYVVAQGRDHRFQSPSRTADELLHLDGAFQAGHVMFRDPVFALDRSRVLALCSELHHRTMKLTWECESRPEHFDGRLLRTMKAAGCTTIKIGLESADPELLVALGRVGDRDEAVTYLDRVAEVVQLSRDAGILCRIFVMAGLPGETTQSTERTAGFIRNLEPARLHVKTFVWYPGISLAQTAGRSVDDRVELLEAAGNYRSPAWQRVADRLRQVVRGWA
ncbi:MAG: radical SAM protein [Chloroflexota bacterium]|nr:radical SAM protein [Chloroflexota bacterium]